jgi:hypothetical protein
MKKIYSLLSILLTSSVMFGQVEIHDDYTPGTNVNGTVVNVDGNDALISAHLHIINKSGSSKNYRWSRTIINTNIATLSSQICDDDGCYVCSGTTWVGLSTMTVANDDSTSFLPKINTQGGGSALIRYYVLDGGNGDAVIDSVDVQFNSFLSVEASKIDFNVYPNPATSTLNISISENNTSISIFDIVGKNVSEMELLNGNNTLNIENLNPGVYFYSIKRNGNIIETKKLVVQ